MNKSLIFTIVYFIFVFSNATAALVTSSQAAKAATDFLTARVAQSRGMAKGGIHLSLSLKTDTYYVFNNDGGGWVMVAADDRMGQVLAFSTEGIFRADLIPDNLCPILQRYEVQTRNLQGNSQQNSIEEDTRQDIGQMLATQWDYYNAVYDAYEKPEVINAEKLLEATRQSKCLYIVLRTDRKVDVSLVTMGLRLKDTVGDYLIYYDPEVQEWYDEQGVYMIVQ